MAPISQLWISGSTRPSSTQKTFDVINPVSQELVGHASAASSEDVVAAITAANEALASWEATPAPVKRRIFLKAAELIQSPKYSSRAVDASHEETGAMKAWVRMEVQRAVGFLLSAASTVTEVQGMSYRSDSIPGGTVIIDRRALGAVLAIAPFNGPIGLTIRSVAVPMACGNTVVLKSPEVSPRCSDIVVEVFHEAGLPKGVLNLIHMAKEDAPRLVAEIIGHKLIRHINFTGSDRVGKIIATQAAKYLKPCVFELGGKAAVVVLNDANVEEAARSIIFGGMANSGQICMSSERIIVQREISSALVDALTKLAKKLHAGTSPSAQLGPLISPTSASNVVSMVSDAKSRGAEVLVGDLAHNGAFVQPHILLGVEPGWLMWERESFGPVLGIKIVDTEEEAIEMANKTDYTLTGAVWTTNIEKGMRVARSIRAGHVMVNAPTISFELRIEYNGLGGATGYGRFDIENFTQRRAVIIAPAGLQLPLVSGL